MKRYCLADYMLTAEIPEDIGFGTQTVTIGGEGSYLDSIKISLTAELYTTQADHTGSWVHVKNLDKTGTIEITVKQVSDKIAIFKSLVNVYSRLNTEAEGMTLTLRNNLQSTDIICIAYDCMLQKISDQEFTNEPGSQTWIFTCGKIEFLD